MVRHQGTFSAAVRLGDEVVELEDEADVLAPESGCELSSPPSERSWSR